MDTEVAGSGRDRLSDLPDCLLHAILSQLQSRQAVQMCLLSPRWTHLWRAVPCINIDSADHFSSSTQRAKETEKEDALAKLEDFADNLLLRRAPEPPLDALRLRVQGPRGETNMGRFIRRGLKLLPAALDVSGGDGYPINLSFLSFSVSGAGGAGRLTRLRLDNVILHRDFEDLLGSGGLPVLEDLEIVNAVIVSGIWRIASDTLTSLAVVDVSCHHQSRCSVYIAAPRLASLRLEFPLARLASLHFYYTIDDDTPACLAQASICLLEEDDGDYPDEKIITDVCFLLNSLSSVTSLHLSGLQDTKQMLLQEVLDHVDGSWTSKLSFPNLTSLVLEDCDLGDNLQALWSFLHTTPAISRLFLYSCEWRYSSDSWERDQEEEDLEITIVVHNLKSVRPIGGDAKLCSLVKKKLPLATVTK